MNLTNISLIILLFLVPSCDIINGDDGFIDPSTNLLRNGSFEIWYGNQPAFWYLQPASGLTDKVSGDGSPGGGQHSIYLDTHVKLSQSIELSTTATEITMSLWARGPFSDSYFIVKTPTSTYTSDTLFSFFQDDQWNKHSTLMKHTIHKGDSITVILGGSGLFDNITLNY